MMCGTVGKRRGFARRAMRRRLNVCDEEEEERRRSVEGASKEHRRSIEGVSKECQRSVVRPRNLVCRPTSVKVI